MWCSADAFHCSEIGVIAFPGQLHSPQFFMVPGALFSFLVCSSDPWPLQKSEHIEVKSNNTWDEFWTSTMHVVCIDQSIPSINWYHRYHRCSSHQNQHLWNEKKIQAQVGDRLFAIDNVENFYINIRVLHRSNSHAAMQQCSTTW